MPISKVAVIALTRVAPFELGVICEAFGTPREGMPEYEFSVCTPDGRPVRTQSGFDVVPHSDLGPVRDADLVAVPAHPIDTPAPISVVAALRAAHDRGASIMSVCSGAFLLGEAGLLDNRRCTTHWMYTDELARRFPTATVHPNALFVEDGPILTSAGTAAGIDLCLHLIRREHGSAVATRLARRMVVPPQREGGQAQYIESPLPRTPAGHTLAPLLDSLLSKLDASTTIDELAARAHMTPRTFARRFRAETGTTPWDWLTAQRVLLARRLLEETDLGVDSVAQRAGFREAATLRHHFGRRVGTTPQAYRSTFRARAAS